MINQQNHVVLVDFGIAKIFKTGQKGTMIGTEGYSPPEQYRGEATPQTDIYALGATLHHLLTHRDPRLEPPFSFSDRPIRSINPQVSIELEQIVAMALQYKPEERYPSASAMKEKLISLARKTGALTRANSGNLVLKEQTVKPVWSFKCEDEIRGSASNNANVVFVGAYDNNLYAIDEAKGEFLWKSAVGGGVISKPLVVNNQVIFGSEDGKIYSVQEKNGKRIWEFPTAGPVRSSARFSEGYLFIGSDDGVLYSIDMVNNRKNWGLKAEGSIRSTPYIYGDMIYFGNEANEFICADFRGQVKWRFWTKRPVTSSPVVSDGIVYFTSLDGLFYALDAKSGWVVWRFRMGKGSISSPTIAETLVFVGSADGYIYCIERANARELWRFKTDHQVSGSPLVYKDALYCGAADGAFYCIDLKTGRQRWRFNSDGPITGTPIANNNVIIIGSADHNLYAFMA
jgi:outer membrane protein assembly factor BamB